MFSNEDEVCLYTHLSLSLSFIFNSVFMKYDFDSGDARSPYGSDINNVTLSCLCGLDLMQKNLQ